VGSGTKLRGSKVGLSQTHDKRGGILRLQRFMFALVVLVYGSGILGLLIIFI